MTPLARPTPAAVQILRLPQVCQRTGLCRSMIYQLEAEHQFPR
jgi:predicted DNA-binding transcriptional regulator AlpA